MRLPPSARHGSVTPAPRRAAPWAFLLLAAASALPARAADEVLTPADNLVAEGLPAVPAALAEELARYESRGASLQGWHPQRRELLITTRFGNTPQVHSVARPGGARRQLTFFRDRVLGAGYPPRGDGSFFVFAKDVGGDEWVQLYRHDVASGTSTLLTDGKSQNSAGAWSASGRWLAYGSTRRNGADRDVYVIDPRQPSSDRRVLEVQGGGWNVEDWSPDEQKLLVSESISANESYLWLVDVASGAKQAVTPRGGPVAVYDTARFSRDGRSLFAATDREAEHQRLARIDLASGRHTYLSTQVPWDVEALELSHDGHTLAFATNEEGRSVLRLLDLRSGRERTAAQLPEGVMGKLAWSSDDREVALSLASLRSPSDVYSVDVATLAVERWTESESGVPLQDLPEPELVRWKSFDGREISGFFYAPLARHKGRRPVMIEIHGGPEAQSRPDFLGRRSYFLRELGVALLYPNVRGSSGYGKTFLTLDNGARREDSVRDIGALFDWIATRPDLDPTRVMVTGGSYGGYMTLAVATHYPDRIRCALDVVGVSNFVTFLENTQAYRRDLRRVEYGDERDPQMRRVLERISPLTNAHKIAKPLFVVHGKNDPRVPYTEAEQIVATLKKNGTPVWYLLAKDEGHGFAKKTNQDFLFYTTVLFVRRHLLD